MSHMSASHLRSSCSSCSVAQLCLPFGLSMRDVAVLNALVRHRRVVQRGEALYRAGDPFFAVFAVRSGALKTSIIDYEGERRIVGFHLSGELLGWDAIAPGFHPCDTTAIDITSVCILPFEQLESLARDIPNLQRQILRLMSRQVSSEHEALITMLNRTAEERVAAILMNFADRLARSGRSDRVLYLPMSRGDLSNYLGLAAETLSRVIWRFKDRGWIRVSGREITLDDSIALCGLAGHECRKETTTRRFSR